MDNNLCIAEGMWNTLPPELQDRVLAFLPVLALFQLRTVCKRWAYLPFCPSFHAVCAQLPPQESYLLVCRRAHTYCAAFDRSMNKWYDIDLRFLDSCCQLLWKGNGDIYHSIEAAAGGLFFVCSHKSDGEACIFSVCNPVTRSWKRLPSLPQNTIPLAVAMIIDKSTFAYKIFIASDAAPDETVSPMAMQVYDSMSLCWKKLLLMPPYLDIVWSSAVCNGILYVLSFDPCDLWAYDMHGDVWSKLEVRVPFSLSMTLLVDCSGSLFLVGEVRGENPRCISIWECKTSDMTCIEIAQVPNPLFQDFSSDETYGMWAAIGHNDFIAFKKGVSRTLIYDVSHRSVQWLPICPGSFDYDSGYSVYGPPPLALVLQCEAPSRERRELLNYKFWDHRASGRGLPVVFASVLGFRHGISIQCSHRGEDHLITKDWTIWVTVPLMPTWLHATGNFKG